jgi:hypothetical protein
MNVTLEAYAQLLARLACRRGATVDEVLAELGIAAGDLGRDEPTLRAQLREAATPRSAGTAMRLAAVLADELQKLPPLGPPAPPPPPPGPPMPVLQRPPLWLAATVPASTGPRATAVMAAASTLASAQGPADAAASLGATVALGAEIAPPPVPPGVVDLTPRQYASLRAELQLRPAQYAAVLERYRVSPAGGREALDAYWRARFEADPLLRMEFARAYAEYIAWLKANPGA